MAWILFCLRLLWLRPSWPCVTRAPWCPLWATLPSQSSPGGGSAQNQRMRGRHPRQCRAWPWRKSRKIIKSKLMKYSTGNSAYKKTALGLTRSIVPIFVISIAAESFKLNLLTCIYVQVTKTNCPVQWRGRLRHPHKLATSLTIFES